MDFNSLILTDASMQVLDSYINFVRPLLKPQCEFVLVTRNGGRHSKLCDVMRKLVFDAIGNFIHPTRYRQIVETQSLNLLTSKEDEDDFLKKGIDRHGFGQWTAILRDLKFQDGRTADSLKKRAGMKMQL